MHLPFQLIDGFPSWGPAQPLLPELALFSGRNSLIHCNRRHRLRRSLARFVWNLDSTTVPMQGHLIPFQWEKEKIMITLWWWITFCHGTWGIYKAFTSQNGDFLYVKLPQAVDALFSYDPHSRRRELHTNLQQGMLGIILQQQIMFNETILWSPFFEHWLLHRDL